MICVTETWLTDETSDTTISIPGYDIHRSDRKDSRGGGCAIHSKTELRATNFVDSSLEGIPETTLKPTEQTKGPVLVGCVYLPPPPSADSIADLSRILSTAHALPRSSTFLLCDFNLPDISWSPTMGPAHYAALLAGLSVEGWSQLARRLTRGLHTLDLIFSKDNHLATPAVGPCFPGCDHCAVSCTAVSYDSGPTTDPVNIADRPNAYFASCYLSIPPNSKRLLSAASLQPLNGQDLVACMRDENLVGWTGMTCGDFRRVTLHRENCTSQPINLKHDAHQGVVQKPKYVSAMIAWHCHTQSDSTPATIHFLCPRPFIPLPTTANKLFTWPKSPPGPVHPKPLNL
ncbi:hypothetical protein CLF_108581 [Clonorchis sinensis]|uniref:Endonuclease/exonuclease/phosphatase domain-containing protein n=1 Tax=Clonorchis sinensis TaxID=79923 RepID=G7YRS6_CLOSI|nr:hypothetical protein CLF_108581 [Clonorchis sinensis]